MNNGETPAPGNSPPPQAGPHDAPLQPVAAVRYGDAAGEHLRMKRGTYTAGFWVGISVLYQVIFLGFFPGIKSMHLIWTLHGSDQAQLFGGIGVFLAVGIAGAYFTYRDRFRCIEAFSSRFCSGSAGLSMLYVPTIAWVYANVRLVMRFFGK